MPRVTSACSILTALATRPSQASHRLLSMTLLSCSFEQPYCSDVRSKVIWSGHMPVSLCMSQTHPGAVIIQNAVHRCGWWCWTAFPSTSGACCARCAVPRHAVHPALDHVMLSWAGLCRALLLLLVLPHVSSHLSSSEGPVHCSSFVLSLPVQAGHGRHGGQGPHPDGHGSGPHGHR